MPENQTAEFVKRFINQTKQAVFLTGKAGTGKTTLLTEIIRTTHKQTVVVAPTGIAALNAGGVTIHSMFQLPFAAFVPDFGDFQHISDRFKIETKDSLMRHFSMNSKRKSLLRNLELLIIDEVSMLRADLLDAMDWMLRNVRKINAPFGGVQVLFIGDLMQLPPVVKQEEWEILRKYYSGIFFFHAKVIQENQPVYIELEKIYRQQDQIFIELLNKLRNNVIGPEDTKILDRYVQPDFDSKKNPGYITLTTHNYKADQLNVKELEALSVKKYSFEAEIKGEFPPHLFPIETTLELKEGAQIMFIKNDLSAEKAYFNGKMGRIKRISEHEILVEFPEDRKTIEVDKYEWENIRYTLDENTREIQEDVVGTFVQYPIKLAWAITVHKSQGLTFEKAILDVTDAFAPGQAYVALSRLRSLDGLVLKKPFATASLKSDQNVINYALLKAPEETLDKTLLHETNMYLLEQLSQAFDWHQLTAAWRIHAASYSKSGSKTEKIKHQEWALHQCTKIEQLNEPAQKFMPQLRNIFLSEKPDYDFLKQRIDAAYSYFFKPLDEVLLSNLKKLEEVKRKPKIKAYFEELLEIDEIQTEVILNLKKIRLMMEAISLGKSVQKENIWNDEIKNYKITKLSIVRHDALQNRSLLDIMDDEESDYEDLIPVKKQKKKEKSEKISSVDQTLKLLEENKSIAEIANLRILSESTVYSHITRLIQAEKIELHQVLSEEKIKALQQAFEGYTEETLSPLKEKYGNKFSWDELRLYRTSLLK